MFGRPVGTWSVARNGTHTFQYDETWLASGDSFPISLSIPLGKGVIEGSYIHDFFDNLLPDSEAIRNHMRIRFQAKSLAAFDLLHEVGRDAVGSMQILPEGELPSTGEITGRVIDEHEIAQTLRGLTQLTSVESVPVDEFRISLPGAQEKTALLNYQGQWMVPHGSTPTTHILKVPLGSFGPLGIDMSSSVENEYLCAKLTKALGIAVAECEIEQFEEIPTLVVTRFDRRWSEDGKQVIRIPQEDFCQVTKTSRADKYESDGGPGIQTIMSILQGSQNASEDRLTFFSAQLLFWLLAAPDGHAKNFSIFLGSSVAV
ncbi:MAG: HipA domain-containing protein, partial [Sphaerochaeta sp.]